MYLSLAIHHVRRYGLDGFEGAVFRTHDVAVSHQCHAISVNAYDAMYNPTPR